MACPTCDHTMHYSGVTQSVPVHKGRALYWCPRCGTLGCDAPSLVANLIEFAGKLTDEHQDLIDEFERLGLRESITTLPPGA